jgi:branched-chain amino acid aminotransferase
MATTRLPRFAFFKGEVVPYGEARIGLLTHALNYGTGCFAGIRAFWNAQEEELFVFRPLDHFRRFLDSARLLAMDLPYAPEDLRDGLLELLRREELKTDSYVRPLAFLADESIGVRLHDLSAAVSMVAIPFGKYIEDDGNGIHVAFSSWTRITDNMIPARGKISGAYVNSALAKTEAIRAGFDEAILLTSSGHISEASAANIFLVRNGALVTPSVTEDILEGITRRTILQLAREELGLAVEERPIDRTEIYVADEAFLCGTGVQIVPISRANHRPVGSGRPGSVTARIASLHGDIVRGRVAKYRDWCAPVYASTPARV